MIGIRIAIDSVQRFITETWHWNDADTWLWGDSDTWKWFN